MATYQTPTFETFCDASKFFIDVKTDEGEDGKMMVNLRKATVVVTSMFGDKVAFMKTNRGQTYRDSRGKKVTRKLDNGDTVTAIRPLFISRDECLSELMRMLDCPNKAMDAFMALNV